MKCEISSTPLFSCSIAHVKKMELIDSVTEIANSAFVAATVGGVLGAAVGALTARIIGARAAERDRIQTQLRATKAASTLAFAICNTAIALKQQHVVPLLNAQHRAISAHRDASFDHATNPRTAQIVVLDIENRTLPKFLGPIDALSSLIYTAIDPSPRLVAGTTYVANSVKSLNDVIDSWNISIDARRSGAKASDADQIAAILGLRQSNEVVDTTYPDRVRALSVYADDIIFFSHLVFEDLVGHSRSLTVENNQRFRPSKIEVPSASFQSAFDAGLMPNSVDYVEWLKVFQ